MDAFIANILSNMKVILDKRMTKHNISDNYLSYILFIYIYNIYFKINDYRAINLIVEQFENRKYRFFLDDSFWYGKAGIGYVLSIIDKKYYQKKLKNTKSL